MSMFSGSELSKMYRITGNQVAWALLGVPAVISWLAVAVVWLIEPRLAVDVDFLAVAMWSGLAWYGLLVVLFFGWFGIFALSAGF